MTSKRRPRDPQATREAILEAACTLMARSGPDAVSLSAVAQLAEVNRGTAYQHFAMRENLVQATLEWVADKMFRAVFGDPETIGERRVEEVDPADMASRLSAFAMENHAVCRVWLMQVLASPDASKDVFWREYSGSLRRFADSDLAVPGIDVEALAVMNLAGAFLWPIWAGAHSGAEGQDGEGDPHGRRFAHESLRISLFGSMKQAAYPELTERLAPPD